VGTENAHPLEVRGDGGGTHPIGPRVRALREAMGLSLRDLAERSGVSAPMLSQVERGETSPTLATAERIAAGLDLSLSQLLRLDEDRHLAIVRRRGGRVRGRRPAAPTTPRSTSRVAGRLRSFWAARQRW
jgi:transcriptional regulator with XRE-family HTH domain